MSQSAPTDIDIGRFYTREQSAHRWLAPVLHAVRYRRPAVLDNCRDMIDSIPKLQRDEKDIEDAQKEGSEPFLDVCESIPLWRDELRSEQGTPRKVLIQREIMSIKDNTQKCIRYLQLTDDEIWRTQA